jgi:hypothetical protein
MKRSPRHHSLTIVAISETRRDAAVLQEHRLDRTILRTYRTTAALDDIVPNPKQPRMGPKEDDEIAFYDPSTFLLQGRGKSYPRAGSCGFRSDCNCDANRTSDRR